MRWFAKIMAFYLLALCGVPCSDSDNRCGDTMHQQEAAHDHTRDHEDYCSPFCHCACCGATITINSFQGAKLILLPGGSISQKAAAPGSPVFISSYSGEIWQPPQLNS